MMLLPLLHHQKRQKKNRSKSSSSLHHKKNLDEIRQGFFYGVTISNIARLIDRISPNFKLKIICHEEKMEPFDGLVVDSVFTDH
jgi:hypothetical protein